MIKNPHFSFFKIYIHTTKLFYPTNKFYYVKHQTMFRSVKYCLHSNNNNNVYNQVSIINVTSCIFYSCNQYFSNIHILHFFALTSSKLEHT